MRLTRKARFRPEVELLLACAREHVLDNLDECGNVFAPEDVDWETVVELALQHRLQPFVYRSFSEKEASIPSNEWSALANASESLVRRNLYMVSELIDVLDRLEAEGLRALTYKGPSLAQLAYRDVTVRKFLDLDLLVPKEDFSDAVDILSTGNYVVEKSFPTYGEKTLREQNTGLLIDLHFSVTPTRYPFSYSFDTLWKRRIEVSLGGGNVWTLSPRDLIPVIAVHGTRHFWVQLEWLVSFAGLAQKESVDWTRVLRDSKQIGSDRMLLLGLGLSRQLLGFSLPETVSTSIANDRIVQLWCRRIISRVISHEIASTQENRSFHYERYLAQLLLMRGVRPRGKYGVRLGMSWISNRLS